MTIFFSSTIDSTTDSRTIYNGEKINFRSLLFCSLFFSPLSIFRIEFSMPKIFQSENGRERNWENGRKLLSIKKIKRFEFTFLPAIIWSCLLCVQFLLACLALDWRKIVIEFGAIFFILLPMWNVSMTAKAQNRVAKVLPILSEKIPKKNVEKLRIGAEAKKINGYRAFDECSNCVEYLRFVPPFLQLNDCFSLSS